MTLDQFIAEITAPLYVYRMARFDKRKGADIRRGNAARKIKAAVKQYAAAL